MSRTAAVREGMQVYGADEHAIGTIESVHGHALQIDGQTIPLSAVARVVKNRVYLADTGARSMATDTTMSTAAASSQVGMRAQETEGTIRVPVVEEQLEVETRAGQIGEVGIEKRTIEEQVAVPVELWREEVHVEERDVADRPISLEEAERIFAEGTIRVPVRGEEAVVTKEAVITGEVVVGKEQTTERQQITDTVRHMEIDVDEHYDRVRHERPASTPVAASEPEGRDRDAPASTSTDTDGWEHLRTEIREGGKRARRP
jgi:uncharacterized protein (TIGR02271 family)